MKIRAFLLAVFLLSLLMGCSRVKIVYNQLDWLLPHYAESYVDFSEDQSIYLRTQIGNLLEWHCSTQLYLYAIFLRDVNQEFEAGGINRNSIDQYGNQIEQFWHSLVTRVVPVITHLILTSDDQQIRGFFAFLEERHQERFAELQGQTDSEIREQYRQRMLDELERWFGPLQEFQKHELRKWSVRLEPLGMEGLANRSSWRNSLRELIRHRDVAMTLQAGLQDHLLNFRDFRTPSYQAKIDHNRKTTIDLLHQVMKRLNQKQKQHFDNLAMVYAREFAELAVECTQPNKPRGGGGNASVQPMYLQWSSGTSRQKRPSVLFSD